MKKKIVIALLVASLTATSLMGCGKSKTSDKKSSKNTEAVSKTNKEKETETEKATEIIPENTEVDKAASEALEQTVNNASTSSDTKTETKTDESNKSADTKTTSKKADSKQSTSSSTNTASNNTAQPQPEAQAPAQETPQPQAPAQQEAPTQSDDAQYPELWPGQTMQSRKAHATYNLYEITTYTSGGVTYLGYYSVAANEGPDFDADAKATDKLWDECAARGVQTSGVLNEVIPVNSDSSVAFIGYPMN